MKSKRYQAVLAVILAFVITFFSQGASYAAKAKAKAPTYKPQQLEQIQLFAPAVADFADKFTNVEALIDADKWTDVRDYIHGPLGELRIKTGRVIRNLLASDRKTAQEVEDTLFKHLVELDTAASDQNYDLCVKAYNAVLNDFAKFLSLVPQG
jgi:photosystem II protein PsbQ